MVSRMAVACGLGSLSACLGRCGCPATGQRRFSVESGAERGAAGPSGPGHSHSRRTKSVIRAEGLFPARLVTGEFYAWVTAGNVTPRRAAPKAIRDKRPACRWLRSSRDNCADQGSIVIESLSKFSAASAAPKWPATGRQSRRFRLANPERPNKKFAGISYSPVTISIRLTESRRSPGPSRRWPSSSARPVRPRPRPRRGPADADPCRTGPRGCR